MTLHRPRRGRDCRGGVRAARARLRRRLGPLRPPAGDVVAGRPARGLLARTRTSRASSPPQHGIGQVGKTTAYVRKLNAGDRRRAEPARDRRSDFVAISTRCMHLGCPSATSRPPSASSARATAASTTSAARSSGGPPVRPLDRFYTRVRNGQVEIGPRFSVNGEFRRFPSYRDPGQDLDGIGQYLYPAASPRREGLAAHEAPAPAVPTALQPKPKRPGEGERVKPLDQVKEAGIATVDWVDERTSLSGAARWVMFRKVPRAPTGSTRWARRRCSPSSPRPSPASSWRCTTTRRSPTRTSRRAT